MATVRMSKSLRLEIKDKAMYLFLNRRARAEKLPDGFGDRCYQAWLAMGHDKLIEDIRSYGEIADEWLGLESFLEFSKINDLNIPQTVQLSTPQYVPKYRYFRSQMVLKGEHCEPLKQEYLSWQRECLILEARQKKFADDIDCFLRTMPTLNRALQVFPALKELVPDQYLRKVNPPKRAYHAHPDVRAEVERLTGEIVQSMILEG